MDDGVLGAGPAVEDLVALVGRDTVEAALGGGCGAAAPRREREGPPVRPPDARPAAVLRGGRDTGLAREAVWDGPEAPRGGRDTGRGRR